MVNAQHMKRMGGKRSETWLVCRELFFFFFFATQFKFAGQESVYGLRRHGGSDSRLSHAEQKDWGDHSTVTDVGSSSLMCGVQV